MTNDRAIHLLESMAVDYPQKRCQEAINTAIKALKSQKSKEDFIILTTQGCNANGLENINYEIAVNKNNIETIRTIYDNTYIHLVSGFEIRVNECIDKVIKLIKGEETSE